MKKQKTFIFRVLDKCDLKGYKAEIKAKNLSEAKSKCLDIYCYALDCMEETITIDLIEII